MYKWDNYTRGLVIGWTKAGWFPHSIALRWPWPNNVPSISEIETIIGTPATAPQVEEAAGAKRETTPAASEGRT